MNISPIFLKSAGYLRFEHSVGDVAIKCLVEIGLICQQSKTTELTFNDPLDLGVMLRLPDRGEEILTALLDSKLISRKDGSNTYVCDFFIETNNPLLNNWRNGEQKRLKAKEAKANQDNLNQSNSTQVNPTQTNSSQLNSVARAEPKQCLSSASDSKETAHTPSASCYYDDDDPGFG
jgi:hypothetical protein